MSNDASTTARAVTSSPREFHFTAADFERVRKLIYDRAGIALAPIKQVHGL